MQLRTVAIILMAVGLVGCGHPPLDTVVVFRDPDTGESVCLKATRKLAQIDRRVRLARADECQELGAKP